MPVCFLCYYSSGDFMAEILYEDKFIVICKKDVGVLSEENESDDSLPGILKKQLGCDIFTLHRLDKPVGGAIMYAKSKKAASSFSKLIAENGLSKTYFAVTDSLLADKSGEMRDLLFKDSRKNKTFVVKRVRKGVKEAVLYYETVKEKDNHALIKIKLETGRSHQIRVQFASRKAPLTGDGKYGSRDNKCTLALWSASLEFTHPFTNEKISISSLPDENAYPWNLFKTENEM